MLIATVHACMQKQSAPRAARRSSSRRMPDETKDFVKLHAVVLTSRHLACRRISSSRRRLVRAPKVLAHASVALCPLPRNVHEMSPQSKGRR
eukprot:3293696-Pleurochrysis_carterae.AAC.3